MSGLLSIVLIIWKGGVLWQMVQTHETKINAMENGGSIGLREHVKLDDNRVQELQAEQARLRNVGDKVIELVGEVKLINFKLDEMKKQLEAK